MKNILNRNSRLTAFCFLILLTLFCAIVCKAETVIEALHIDEQHSSEKNSDDQAPEPHIDPIQKDKELNLILNQQIKICKNQLDKLRALSQRVDTRIKETNHSQITGIQSETYTSVFDVLQKRTKQLNEEVQMLHSSIDRLTNRMLYIACGNILFLLIVCIVLFRIFRKTKQYSYDRENILLQKFAAIVRRYSKKR